MTTLPPQVKMRKRYSVEQSLIHPWLQVGIRIAFNN